MASTFTALADPHRRQVLDLLRERERPVNDLVAHLEISQPAVSKHLRVLREAGLVDVRKDAQRRLYRLRPTPLREVGDWLEPYRWFWEERLDALGRVLDAEAAAAANTADDTTAGFPATTDEGPR